MTATHLPPAEYYARAPKSMNGAGAIFHDPAGRILLVQPTYRTDTWEVPGGGLEEGEFPLDAAVREVMEELGITVRIGRLLAVDWVPPQPDGRPALANHLFDGGPITADWATTHLRLQTDELRAWRLTAADEWPGLLAPHMVRRLHACARALRDGTTAYLHHGYDPATPHP
ncbi:NUDIX domain-containing protein [Catenuloplanes sp. NPDC051500]|uniref:NUDIX domain-containing protein n=1 Tax=Catenuloplanes sp. NPDC051500 TaxID=3363959 RepID=UPI0037A6FB67